MENQVPSLPFSLPPARGCAKQRSDVHGMYSPKASLGYREGQSAGAHFSPSLHTKASWRSELQPSIAVVKHL